MEIPLYIYILSVFGLLLLSGFFSGSETGLTAVSKAKIHKLASEGNKRAGYVRHLKNENERLIGSILLGNNLVNIAATVLATTLFTQLFGIQGVAYATLVMTVLVLIFAEVLPKTYAIQHPEKVALWVAPFFIVIVKLLSPITRFVQILVNMTLSLFQSSAEKQQGLLSATEELRGAIDMHHEQGDVLKRDRDMLGSILDLKETEIGVVMRHRTHMYTICADNDNSEIIQQALDSRHTRIPLWSETPDNIVGVLHVKDLLKALRSKQDIDHIDMVKEVAQPPWFIPNTISLSDQLHAFRVRRIHFALVIDEYGALMGLVTLEDVLEEIVGEIEDEHDIVNHNHIKRVSENVYDIYGEVSIRDLNRQLDWNLPDEEVSTIAGLVIHKAEQIPEEKEQFEFDGYRFEVLTKEQHHITRLRAEKLSISSDREDAE